MKQVGKEVVDALTGLPVYLVMYFVGFLVIAMTEVSVTSLVIGSILLGFLTSPLLAVTTFFLVYVALKAVQTLALAITMKR